MRVERHGEIVVEVTGHALDPKTQNLWYRGIYSITVTGEVK